MQSAALKGLVEASGSDARVALNALEIAAYAKAKEQVKNGRNEPVPLHLRNPVAELMKAAGYGKDYKYAHNYEGHFIEQQFLPDALKQKHFYMPSAEGFENTVLARLKRLWTHRFQDDKK